LRTKKLENLGRFAVFNGVSTPTKKHQTKGFRVNRIIGNRMRARKRRLGRRLARRQGGNGSGRRVLGRVNSHLELADKTVATGLGGAALAVRLARKLKLAEEIDARVSVFRRHLPYHESDHVLNLALSAFCGGTCLDDLELRRQDEAYLNLLGAERVPDPTTAGDFCRRFQRPQLETLQAAIDAARVKVWQEQSPDFFAEACIEADGTLVRTGSECKQGVDYSYKGDWGYHPLVITLTGTGEVLRLINRSGNRPSHEGAAEQFDQCIELCRKAGFRRILLRGDTDFSQTAHLDRWHEQGYVQFVFGYDCSHKLHYLADELPENAWKTLPRQPRYTVKTATITVIVEDGGLDGDLSTTNDNATFDRSFSVVFEPAPLPSLSVSAPIGPISEVNSGLQQVYFTVSLSREATDTVNVNYTTSTEGYLNAATPVNDFTPTNGVLTFAPGETSKLVPVLIRGDRLIERDELFGLLLSSPTNAILREELADLVITDDDNWAYPLQIDFGTGLSPVQGSASAIGTMAYDSGKGLGWTAGLTGLRVVDRGIGVPGLRDIALTPNSSFGFNVPNGQYLVRITFGDATTAHDHMRVKVEGAAKPALSTGINQFITRAYAVNVSDGRLDLEFEDLGGVDPDVAITGIGFGRR
jgi:hypothetical protein